MRRINSQPGIRNVGEAGVGTPMDKFATMSN